MKTITEMYEDMLEVFRQETGYAMEDSADLAVRLRAFAAEAYSLYVYADWVGRMAFPQTAEGEFLDRHAQLRGLERRGAARAQGKIRFYISRALSYDIPIAQGVYCSTMAGTDFVTTEAGTIAAGTVYADIPAEAVKSGASGNVRSGVIVSMALPPAGVEGCTNPNAFTGGLDGETDASLRDRLLDTYKHLPNGANAAYYEKLVMADDEVLAVKVLPRHQGIGTVGVVVTPIPEADGDELVERLQTLLDQQREIAVDVTVMQPTEVTVNVTMALDISEGWEYERVAASVRKAVEGAFDGTMIGQDLLLRRLYECLAGVEGLRNYSISLPTSDVTIQDTEMPVLGTLLMSEKV